ncbi:MAG: DUF5367 family protein [Candidatus Pacearchaeota archaeon]|jgi:hypothetical protein
MNLKRGILFGSLLWVLIFVWWSVLIFIPGLNETLQYVIHYCLLIVAASFIANLYYRKKDKVNGFLLGLVFLGAGLILDTIITVPLFTMPQGVGYLDFFFAPLMLVGYAISVLTVGIYDKIMNK